MMATTCDGSRPENGKSRPVTLVKIVVRRKSAVQPGSGRAPNMPRTTTKPVTIPIRLKTTCRVVKADSDKPIIIADGLLAAPSPLQMAARIPTRPGPHNETTTFAGARSAHDLARPSHLVLL